MRTERVELYRKLEEARDTKLISYVTGDRRGWETQIHPEAIDMLATHLDEIGQVERISLFLYTRGGHTAAAWSIVNLIRQYCTKFEVIAPAKALSAGTLISLGADQIVMTQQSTLGPIDPSVNTPLNPIVPAMPGAPPNQRYSVSVEDINGYIELAKETGVRDGQDLVAVLAQLTQHVHPLVLGKVFRTRSQIKMLGDRLLSRHMSDGLKRDRILAFLCSESGSHDYTIDRQEASADLGLPIEEPDEIQYDLIRKLHRDIASELQLTEPYEPRLLLSERQTSRPVPYEFTRALIESVDGGSHRFVTRGQVAVVMVPKDGTQEETVADTRITERWEYDPK